MQLLGTSKNAFTFLNFIDLFVFDFRYYLNGKTAKASDFVDPEIFDALYDQINITKTIVRKLQLQATPIWLGICLHYYL